MILNTKYTALDFVRFIYKNPHYLFKLDYNMGEKVKLPKLNDMNNP